MKHAAFHQTGKIILLMVLIGFSAQASAQRVRQGIWGDWQVNVDFNERQWESILSFSKDSQGNRIGQSISFWGMNELQDIKFNEGQLTFVQSYRSRDGQERRSNFTGTVKEGKLSGTFSSDRGEFKVEGTRAKRMSRALGNWELKLKVGEREFTAMLIVKTDKDNNLTARWQSDWGEHEIKDVKYEKGKLTFNRKSKVQDREWESTFEGTIKRHALSGMIKSQRGEVAVEGKHTGAALIGKWILDIESEQRTRQQRLKVHPDLSGLYGSAAIEKIDLIDDQVSFTLMREFRDQKFEMTFQGKLEGTKLIGELTSSRGNRKVTGEKILRKPKKD